MINLCIYYIKFCTKASGILSGNFLTKGLQKKSDYSKIEVVEGSAVLADVLRGEAERKDHRCSQVQKEAARKSAFAAVFV